MAKPWIVPTVRLDRAKQSRSKPGGASTPVPPPPIHRPSGAASVIATNGLAIAHGIPLADEPALGALRLPGFSARDLRTEPDP